MVSRAARIEPYRLRLLVERDGLPAAVAWVERTLGIYRLARADPRSPCAWPPYRERLGEVVLVQRSWLAKLRSPGALDAELDLGA